jgi:hypothetical protein
MDHPTTRLHDFFHALSRKTFAELGMPDDQVVAYVAALLTEFASANRVHGPHTTGPHTLGTVVAMLMQRQKEAANPTTIIGTRELRKYVGDYTLFMSGLFRAHVERTGDLDFYLSEGRRSYWAVSELDLSLTRTGFLFFQQMSRNFEFYSGALDYMRKAYFAHAPGTSPFAEFARQVRGWIAGGLSDN